MWPSKRTVFMQHFLLIFSFSLPIQYSNEELAYGLFERFKEHGTLLSLKASRDEKGRPFGFIEYENKEQAERAIQESQKIYIFGRKVRTEQARCQRKIQVRILKEYFPIAEELSREIFFLLQQQQLLPSAVVSVRNLPEEICINFKFSQAKFSFYAHKALLDWIGQSGLKAQVFVNWLSAKNMIPSITAGLEGEKNYICESASEGFAVHAREMFPNVQTGVYWEMNLNGNCVSCGEVGYNASSGEMHLRGGNSAVTKAQVFVGRLNPLQVTEEALHSIFSTFGTVEGINLINKRIIGPDGVMLDAFAFVTFSVLEAAQAAIIQMNGEVLFGQSIKCTWSNTNDRNPNSGCSVKECNMLPLHCHSMPLVAPGVQI